MDRMLFVTLETAFCGPKFAIYREFLKLCNYCLSRPCRPSSAFCKQTLHLMDSKPSMMTVIYGQNIGILGYS
jgi:hypothetical protein